jgi:acetyl esterase/lipase
MNIPTLMTKIAALQGHPIPISVTPAPYDATDSTVVVADAAQQVRPSRRGLRMVRNREFARVPGRGGETVALRMDVLVPEGSGPHPLVISVPGGGFVRAPKVGAGTVRRHLAQAGYVVASVEYRTTMQGATFIEGVSDVKAAVRYLRAHAAEFGIDPKRVALWGESAGGYIASMVGVTAGDKRFESGSDADQSSDVQAVVNKFGGSDLTLLAAGFDEPTVAANSGAHIPLAHWVLGANEKGIALADAPDAVRDADPATYATKSAPPFLLFHGSDDRIVSPVQTAHLHAALRAAGADSTRYLVRGAGHGEIAVVSGEERFWTTEPMLRIATDFLDRVLAPSKVR